MPIIVLKPQVLAIIEEKGGFAPIFERLADGERLADIAADYTPPGRDKPISRTWFYWVITQDPDNKEAYQHAMTLKADKLVEDAGQILDDAELDRDAIRKAEVRANFRTWLAGKLNRKQYGEQDKQGVQVTLNVETLHLDALRKFPARPQIAPVNGNLLPIKEAVIEPDVQSTTESNPA